MLISTSLASDSPLSMDQGSSEKILRVSYSIFHKAFHYFLRCFLKTIGNSFYFKLSGLQLSDCKNLQGMFFFWINCNLANL